MRLIIPSEIEIGAHTYKIIKSNKALDIADIRANVSHHEQLIRLSTHWEGRPRSKSMIFEALLHELLHPVNQMFMGGELNEKQIEQIAAGLAQSLLSLGIEPDFSEIQEEEL